MRTAAASWLLALALLALAQVSARAGDPPKAPNLFGDLAALAPSQKDVTDAAHRGNLNAFTAARNSGVSSIVRGVRNIRIGRVDDVMPQVRLGRFQVVEGILGLLAARQAKKLAESADARAGDLATAKGDSSGAGAGGPAASGGSGLGDPSMTGASRSPASAGRSAAEEALAESDPSLKEGLAALEEDHGLTREKLLAAMNEGATARDILAKAPLNPLSADELAAAEKAAHKELPKRLVATAPAAAAPLAAAVSGAALTAAPAAAPPAAGTVEEPRKGRGGALREQLSRSLASSDSAELSPEVRGALAAREAREQAELARLAAPEELDLFAVVHLKYRTRENNIRWGEPLRTANAFQ